MGYRYKFGSRAAPERGCWATAAGYEGDAKKLYDTHLDLYDEWRSNCWIPRRSVPPLFSLFGVLWRTKHNTIDAILIQWHANKWQGIEWYCWNKIYLDFASLLQIARWRFQKDQGSLWYRVSQLCCVLPGKNAVNKTSLNLKLTGILGPKVHSQTWNFCQLLLSSAQTL